MFGKIVAGILGGFIVSVLGAFVVTIALASDPETGGTAGGIAFFAFWILSIVIALIAERAGKAWRRLLITSSILCFMLPLASFIFSGAQVAQTESGAEAAGAALGGGMITLISGFVGFFLGVVFLIIGLMVGRDVKVITVKEGETVS